jgi:uncharacterized cupin superfamily protein
MSARALGAPLHRHTHEDEYSYVLEGRVGALLGESVVVGGRGDLIFKPRQQWHTFWNAGDEPCRILEIISPSGFEHFFKEMGDTIAVTDAKGPGDVLPNSDLPERYAIEFQPERTAEICQKYGVRFPGLPED